MPGPFEHPKTGVFYYRKVVPEPLRGLFGKTEIRISLRTKNLKKEQALYRPISVEVEAQIEAQWRTVCAVPPSLSSIVSLPSLSSLLPQPPR